MIELTLHICFAGLGLAILLSLVRMAKGPTILDRILAFDLIAISVVGMIVLLSVLWRTSVYLELILIFSLLGFFGTVAFVFHLHKTLDNQTDEAPVTPKETPDTQSPPVP